MNWCNPKSIPHHKRKNTSKGFSHNLLELLFISISSIHPYGLLSKKSTLAEKNVSLPCPSSASQCPWLCCLVPQAKTRNVQVVVTSQAKTAAWLWSIHGGQQKLFDWEGSGFHAFLKQQSLHSLVHYLPFWKDFCAWGWLLLFLRSVANILQWCRGCGAQPSRTSHNETLFPLTSTVASCTLTQLSLNTAAKGEGNGEKTMRHEQKREVFSWDFKPRQAGKENK